MTNEASVSKMYFYRWYLMRQFSSQYDVTIAPILYRIEPWLFSVFCFIIVILQRKRMPITFTSIKRKYQLKTKMLLSVSFAIFGSIVFLRNVLILVPVLVLVSVVVLLPPNGKFVWWDIYANDHLFLKSLFDNNVLYH